MHKYIDIIVSVVSKVYYKIIIEGWNSVRNMVDQNKAVKYDIYSLKIFFY